MEKQKTKKEWYLIKWTAFAIVAIFRSPARKLCWHFPCCFSRARAGLAEMVIVFSIAWRWSCNPHWYHCILVHVNRPILFQLCGQNANRTKCQPDKMLGLFIVVGILSIPIFGWHFVRTISRCFGILSKPWKMSSFEWVWVRLCTVSRFPSILIFLKKPI